MRKSWLGLVLAALTLTGCQLDEHRRHLTDFAYRRARFIDELAQRAMWLRLGPTHVIPASTAAMLVSGKA